MKNGNKVKIVVVVVITVKMMMVIKMMVDKLMLNVDTRELRTPKLWMSFNRESTGWFDSGK